MRRGEAWSELEAGATPGGLLRRRVHGPLHRGSAIDKTKGEVTRIETDGAECDPDEYEAKRRD